MNAGNFFDANDMKNFCAEKKNRASIFVTENSLHIFHAVFGCFSLHLFNIFAMLLVKGKT